MNIEALVEAVTKEVYKKLQGMKPLQEQPIKRQKAIIMDNQAHPEIEAHIESHYDFQYYDEQTRDCDLVIIPTICIQLLGNLANGISAGSRERFILTMLLKGKKVVALENSMVYKKYKQTANPLLYKQYEEFEERIKSFGIQMVQVSDLLNIDGKEHKPEVASTKQESEIEREEARQEVISKKLITESDLKKFHLRKVNQIIVSKNSIITPLAKDYIKMQQIQVRRK
ncbi:ethanolamine utilization protein [Brevibacillus laterosporus]|uniref:ethanolamine utilization protein n=1 Tax=Brevibacillus laterosporus TaxID=1465 RepID=UPI000CE4A7B5|nr:ethanolamine utilization protein [Brevibacillus laterosporus]MBG9774848.1 ethanolamine utilization protein [Brevibacillus laterosporus]MBG9798790.1 ethanolamine utilization protein [Brevibacillus laterosporus]MCR8936014.1 ethanolamine utilization protein [Brevibacillus laterosporus]MCZ0838653.1 ethanolamine utilization protein [Brevibacillus laterosporus]MCZ0843188.1 ethanolamine utilization protein [Brevibacillus laterosporus]